MPPVLFPNAGNLGLPLALFAFGGIYAAGVLDWSSVEIGTFGILLTITGTFGAVIGGRLDDRLGPRPVIAGALVVLHDLGSCRCVRENIYLAFRGAGARAVLAGVRSPVGSLYYAHANIYIADYLTGEYSGKELTDY